LAYDVHVEPLVVVMCVLTLHQSLVHFADDADAESEHYASSVAAAADDENDDDENCDDDADDDADDMCTVVVFDTFDDCHHESDDVSYDYDDYDDDDDDVSILDWKDQNHHDQCGFVVHVDKMYGHV
jgi:hypothetical protein